MAVKTATKYSKEALVKHFSGTDSALARVLLKDEPQTIKQATDTINNWKKEEVK